MPNDCTVEEALRIGLGGKRMWVLYNPDQLVISERGVCMASNVFAVPSFEEKPKQCSALLFSTQQHGPMSHYRDFIDWIEAHQSVALDVIRIYLGIGLFVRGVLFVSEPEGLGALVDLSNFSMASAGLGAYVTVAHLVGGLLLATGLLTRIAAAVQIPILIGAVVLVHWQDGLLSANQSLEFSVLVLFLLSVVFLFGAGRWSADWYVFRQEPLADDAADLKMWWRDEQETSARPAPSPAGDGAGTDEGGVTVASAKTKAETVTQAGATTECACGHDLSHPRVTIEPNYGWTAGFYFVLGISAPVKEIVFYCEECDTVMKRSQDPELLERYRWHTS